MNKPVEPSKPQNNRSHCQWRTSRKKSNSCIYEHNEILKEKAKRKFFTLS